jgi:hypothetical protein
MDWSILLVVPNSFFFFWGYNLFHLVYLVFIYLFIFNFYFFIYFFFYYSYVHTRLGPVFLEKGEALYAGKIPQKLFTMPSICQFPILEWTDK